MEPNLSGVKRTFEDAPLRMQCSVRCLCTPCIILDSPIRLDARMCHASLHASRFSWREPVKSLEAAEASSHLADSILACVSAVFLLIPFAL